MSHALNSPHTPPLNPLSGRAPGSKTDSALTSAVPRARILVIEDDSAIAEVIFGHLNADYDLVIEADGLRGFQRANEETWSLIVLDVRLPNKDGLEICRDLRAHSNDTPVLMLTSRSGELDRVLGLEMGADDYMVKPFSMLELGARIKALLRRAAKSTAPAPEVSRLSVANMQLDLRTHECWRGGQALTLTSTEFDLLALFMSHPGTVFTRVELLERVWGYGHSGYEHTVNSHINRLRAKLENNPSSPSIIVTVWGVGYKFNGG